MCAGAGDEPGKVVLTVVIDKAAAEFVLGVHHQRRERQCASLGEQRVVDAVVGNEHRDDGTAAQGEVLEQVIADIELKKDNGMSKTTAEELNEMDEVAPQQ